MRATLTWLIGLLTITAGLTGCIGDAGDDLEGQSDDAEQVLNLTAQETQLFPDPQTNAHPSFDFPTFTTLPEDPPADAPAYWRPIEANEFSVDDLSLEHIGEDPDGAASYGTGIAIFGELVIVPGRSTGNAWIFDISSPEDPALLSEFEAGGRDVDTIAFPDGRLFAVFATDSGVVPIWNITNPENPSKAAELSPDRGSHNVGIVPGTPILYNSASLGGGAGAQVPGQGQEGTAIYDLSDPESPELITDFENGYSCHDITFSIREANDTYRAYCAGIEVTQIWDIEDPAAPEVIVDVPVHHGVSNVPAAAASPVRFSHLAMANQAGDVLIVGDETGGGAAPGCDVHVQDGPATLTGPLGNLYFYDISDETSPQLTGAISADSPALMTDEVSEDPTRAASSCTAHFGRIIPADGKDLLAMSFYGPGVTVIDFTDPANPQIVQQWNEGTNTWDVWYYNGYLVTGDITRGMDVLRIGSS